MCQEMEQQKMKTRFQFSDEALNQQVHEFEHPVLEPQNLQRELENVRNRENVIQGLRAAITNQPLPAMQVRQTIRPAQPQAPAPQPAPPEKSWKELRSERKQREKNLKRGKKLTAHADELTADLVEEQQAWAENIQGFRDHDYMREDISGELTDTLQSMRSVRITAEMFTDENFLNNYAMLRETLEKAAHIARIAASAPHMEQLRQQDIVLYCTALRWQRMEPTLREMFRLANASHGLKENGEVLGEHELAVTAEENGVETVIPNIVHHTRSRYDKVLDKFRSDMASQEQEHQERIFGDLQSEFEQRLAGQKLRAPMDSTEEQRQWSDSASLAYGSAEAYEVIGELKGLIEKNGGKYLANKESVDRMYSDIIRRFELLGELRIRKDLWLEIENEYRERHGNRPRTDDGNRLFREANRRAAQTAEDANAVAENLSTLRNALERFLQGKPFNMLETAALESYGFHAVDEMKRASAPLREQASARARREKWQTETLEELIRRGDFKPAERTSQYVTRAVTLFRQGDDAYNLRILNTLQKYEKYEKEYDRLRPAGTGKMSAAEAGAMEQRRAYYEELRGIAEPAVRQILDWDMDRFMQMDDRQLMEVQTELDELFGANMFISDLMKLRHPAIAGCMMKDELLGDRLDEYSHRLTVLRNLTDRSRGLALKALAGLGLPAEECLTKQEREDMPSLARAENVNTRSAKAHLLFAEKQIRTAEALQTAEEKKWADMQDPGSEAFRKKCDRRREVVRRLPDRATHLDEAARRHTGDPPADAPQEQKDLHQRLYRENYRIACWDTTEAVAYAKERGLDLGDPAVEQSTRYFLGEPFFRTYSAYIQTPGARTQTPEDFEQMLRELSAGAQLQRGVSSDEEIFEAREKNMRGCLRFKETLRVSYEYLGRKYGFGFETLTAQDIYDHIEEIMRDFGNAQVDANFINNLPGILDMENEEDRALYHKINYLTLMAKAVQNFLMMVSQETYTAEQYIESLRKHAVTRGGLYREALKGMGESSGMAAAVTWGDGVQVGQRRPLPADDPEAREERWQKFRRSEEERRHTAALETGAEGAASMFREAELEAEFEEELEREVAVLDELEDVFDEKTLAAWREKGVFFPNRHTARLYEVRAEEAKAFNAKANVSHAVMKERGAIPPLRLRQMFWSFLPKFELKENGALSAEDTETIRKMTEDFFYGQKEARNAILDQMVEDICSMQFTAEMFYPEYIRSHFEQMKQLDRKLLLIGNFRSEYPDYFQALPAQVQELLSVTRDFSSLCSMWVANTLAISGLGPSVDSQQGEKPSPEAQQLEARREQEESVQTLLADWRQARQAYLQR